MAKANKKKSAIWMCYDLGVRGDYESLYAWLDDHGAKDCVDSLAFLIYEHEGPLMERLEADLREAVEVDNRTRIHVIRRDPTTGENRGTFLFGGRKAPTWSGYSAKGAVLIDEV